jgi:DNA topoisomerase III
MKKLIIAEKKSVGEAIAKTLGGFEFNGRYFENENLIIAHAQGHLIGIAAPANMAKDFPCIPERFDLEPTEERLLPVLRDLINRRDVGEIMNACDAGREGELIFRLIIEYVGTNKKISRMWFQSMTPAAIVDAFNNPRTDEQMQNLSDAARARVEADWLLGINGSRLTQRIANAKTPVGRVLTPTVMLIVEREKAIQNFRSKPFWEVHADIAIESGEFTAKWYATDPLEGVPSERILDEAAVTVLVNKVSGAVPENMTEEAKLTKKQPPLLFDLTTLQREANKLFGYTAAHTLEIAQKLYEHKKCLTYPRTDAACLPEDFLPTITATFNALASQNNNFAGHIAAIFENDWLQPKKRIFNNAKISDHFAIIPTEVVPGQDALSAEENDIYQLVVFRTIAAFFPDVEINGVTRTFTLADEAFFAQGQVFEKQGWFQVYQNPDEEDSNDAALPRLEEGEQGELREIKLHQGKTTPPSRFTEATLLGAMEKAGRNLEDEELREAMGEKGLGTPATRANTIENMVSYEYVERAKKQLLPTQKAFDLDAMLRNIDAGILLTPEVTAEWETDLARIEKGEISLAKFLDGIRAETLQLVTTAQSSREWADRNKTQAIGQCPRCKSEVVKFHKGYSCVDKEGCGFVLWSEVAGKLITDEQAITLLQGGQTKPVKGLKSRSGTTFEASLALDEGHKVKFVFEEPDTYQCPKCGKNLFHRTKPGKTGYNFWGCEGYKDKSCNASFENYRNKPKFN